MIQASRFCGVGRWVGLVAVVLALGIGSARAQDSAAKVCSDVAKKAKRVLWDDLREAANASHCRKPWVNRKAHEFLACTGVNKTVKFSSTLRDRWNRFFDRADAEWAAWGPRGIAEPWERGTIRAGFKRTYFGVGMARSTSTVEVRKRGGRAAAYITVCELNQQGAVVRTHRRSFPSGKDAHPPRKVVIRNGDDTRILAVVVDTKVGTNEFQYQAKLDNEPLRNDLGPIAGIADLHVHQFAELAFGARMMWGEHDGPPATALQRDHLSTPTPRNLTEALKQVGNLDANLLMSFVLNQPDTQGNVRTDEGFVEIPREGYPSYKHWPHHADRSHQQVHISWLEEAVQRNRRERENLSLMVTSIVHNDILCKVYKAFDPNGNIPVRDNKGKITGWKSAPWKCEDDESVKLQLDAAHALERKYPWYRIALNPWHARQIIADGDLAVVLALETDKVLSDQSGKYSNWENTLDFYRTKGLTTLQVVHESNSIFCGAALHRGMMQALQGLHFPVRSIANLLKGDGAFDTYDSGPRKGQNRIGITEDGKRLVDAMVARHMPIDLAHGSVRCREDIISRVPYNYGLYDSHTKFERLLYKAGADWTKLKKEGKFKKKINEDYRPYSVLQREKTFVVSDKMIPLYRDNKVLIGLRTASIDVDTAPTKPGKKPNPAHANICPGSAHSFAQYVKYAHDQGLLYAYGTDFNTGVSQLGPRFNKPGGPDIRCYAARNDIKRVERTTRRIGPQPPIPARANQVKPIAGTNYYYDGLATIGWLPELTRDLRAMQVPGAEQLTQGAENYLQMWERAYDHGSRKPGWKPPEGHGTGGCKADTDCRTGEFCSKPALGQSVCLPRAAVDLGGKCSSDRQCATGRCSSLDGTGGTCVCANDGHCGSNRYCDKGWLTVGKNQCVAFKAYGAGCSRDEQCKSPSICKGKPAGKCITEASLTLGERCIKDAECQSGSCNKDGRCQCKQNGDCPDGRYCATGTAGVGKNTCVVFKKKGDKCSAEKQCGPGLSCKGVVGFKKCK